MRALITARRLALLMTLLTAVSVYLSFESIEWLWAPAMAAVFAVCCWGRFQRVRSHYLDDRRWFQGVGVED